MRVEISHGRESVKERLAIVSRSPLEQLGQASDGVEGPRGKAVGFSSRPTCEQGTSVSSGKGNLVRDGESLLELSGHADKLVDGLFHVLDFGKEVLGVAHFETELTRSVTHYHCEGVRANDAGRGVDPVEVGAAVDAVEQRKTVLELTFAHLESVEVSAKFHRNETAATIIDRASGFDHRTAAAHCILDDLPETGVGDCRVSVGNRNSDRLAVVAATKVAPASERSVVCDQQGKTFDIEREGIVELNNGNDLGEAVPSLFDSSLNVAIFQVSCHSVFSFCNVLWLTDGGQSTGCGGILQAGK